MVVVVIEKLPIATFSYFQWFLLGLYELEQKHEIKLKFRISLASRFALLWCNNKYVGGALRTISNKMSHPDCNLMGYIVVDGIKKTFTIDPKDSPFLYDVAKLESCDIYFKLQCPKEFEKEGFLLAPNVRIPYCDVKFGINPPPFQDYSRLVSDRVFELRNKIKPGMIGPRRLAWGCKYSALKNQYELYLRSRSVQQSKSLTAYFRYAEGPVPTSNLAKIDPDLEWDLMAYYKTLCHPNVKRDKAVKMMNSSNNPNVDGRMIFEKDGKTGAVIHHSSKEVPLDQFCDYVASFHYNLNISGFRLSIPNRFIESFIGGTAIVTDKLALKWYLPFEEEVFETVEMGYLQENEIDWEQFKQDILNLPVINKRRIIDLFETKWSPVSFAKYVITEVCKG